MREKREEKFSRGWEQHDSDIKKEEGGRRTETKVDEKGKSGKEEKLVLNKDLPAIVGISRRWFFPSGIKNHQDKVTCEHGCKWPVPKRALPKRGRNESHCLLQISEIPHCTVRAGRPGE